MKPKGFMYFNVWFCLVFTATCTFVWKQKAGLCQCEMQISLLQSGSSETLLKAKGNSQPFYRVVGVYAFQQRKEIQYILTCSSLNMLGQVCQQCKWAQLSWCQWSSTTCGRGRSKKSIQWPTTYDSAWDGRAQLLLCDHCWLLPAARSFAGTSDEIKNHSTVGSMT